MVNIMILLLYPREMASYIIITLLLWGREAKIAYQIGLALKTVKPKTLSLRSSAVDMYFIKGGGDHNYIELMKTAF